ncbi:hypothetical protein [Hippea alviniae]|uniref:hypothetical protein n=1 Tax=Hippea alviniae TaxID=1279027 RepID=UPI0003B56B1F|nr:hypothetical protein [Hippea alviniae]
MKKNVFLGIIAISLLFATFSTTARAKLFQSGSTIVSGDTFTPSQGVSLVIVSNSNAYTMESDHKQGRYKYATTNNDEVKKAKCTNDPCGTEIDGDKPTAGTLPSWTWVQ